MFDWYKYDIVKPIYTNSKIIIGLGDSFTQGHGACSLDLWEKCDWKIEKREDEFEYQLSFYQNSWVHQLCEKYMPDYTPINMGMSGRGNRAAVKELYLHPELNFEIAKEKIVIFMLSGYERFDFVNRDYFEHIHFDTMWPLKDQNVPKRLLWDSYYDHIWSDRVGIIEMLLAIAEAKMWCKANNAKLYLTSAFRPEYSHDYFYKTILEDCECNGGKTENYLLKRKDHVKKLVDQVDWNRYIKPNNHGCMVDYILELEGLQDMINTGESKKFYDYSYSLEKMSPNGYITKVAHPSAKGHDAMAKIIYKNINKLL